MKRELTCKICGFVTYNDEDMIDHLAHTQELEQENCNLQILEVKE